MSSHNATSHMTKKSVMSSSTPYLDRKKKQDTEQQRLDRKRDNNALPPKLGNGADAGGGGMINNNSSMMSSVLTANTSQFEREGFNVDRLRDNLPLQGGMEDSVDNTIYTGGPIAPANKFPAVRK